YFVIRNNFRDQSFTIRPRMVKNIFDVRDPNPLAKPETYAIARPYLIRASQLEAKPTCGRPMPVESHGGGGAGEIDKPREQAPSGVIDTWDRLESGPHVAEPQESR